MSPAERKELLARLRGDAQRISGHFALSYRDILAERANVKSRYGICYADGLIKIRLAHAKTGRPLRYSSLIDTLCHELAHLKHFDHGPEFQHLFWRMLGWARKEGIYCPAAQRGSQDRGAQQRGAQGSQTHQPSAKEGSEVHLPQHNGVPVFEPLSTQHPKHWPPLATEPRKRPEQLSLF